MATGDILNVRGSWAIVQASNAVANGNFSAGSRTTMVTALGATEADYSMLDFHLDITSGTPSDGGVVGLYRIPNGNSSAAPTPDNTSLYLAEPVGRFSMMDVATSDYYVYNVPSGDPNDTYIIKNLDGSATLTMTLRARGKTRKASA